MAAPAVLRALEQTWSALCPLNLPMAVMGGLALAAWKYPRATRDVDLIIGIGSMRPDDVLSSLLAADFRTKHSPAVRPLGNLQILQVEIEPEGMFVSIPVDLLLADSEYHRQALARAIPFHLPEVVEELRVLTCEDMILHKLLAGRMIDRSDAAALIRANRDTLNLDELIKWVQALRLQGVFLEVWKEASPASAPPALADET
jgi:hypothetical protein